MASHPTAADGRAYFDEWAAFYRDFYQFPTDLPADIDHGFDSRKVIYCTVDVGLVLRRALQPEHLRRAQRERGELRRATVERHLRRRRVRLRRPDYLGLGDSTVPRHRYFHAATEASSAAGLPPTWRELLTASHLRAGTTNPDDELRVRLRQNAVDRWRPRAPIRVYHSPVDEEVFFEDTLVSVGRLRSRGAEVTVRRLPASTTSTAGSRPCPGRSGTSAR